MVYSFKIPSVGIAVENYEGVRQLNKCLSETTYVHEGRTTSREDRVGLEIFDKGNGASTKRPEVCGTGLLPVIPELVDHLKKKNVN